MKSLFFPIVFAFCFVMKLAGTKAVLTGEKPSSSKSQNKACHGRPLPSAVRPQKPIYAIDWHSFLCLGLEINTLFSALFLSDTLCTSKGKRGLYRTQDAMGTPVEVRLLYLAPFKNIIGLMYGIRLFYLPHLIFCLSSFYEFTTKVGNKIPQKLETKYRKSWKQNATKVGNKC